VKCIVKIFKILYYNYHIFRINFKRKFSPCTVSITDSILFISIMDPLNHVGPYRIYLSSTCRDSSSEFTIRMIVRQPFINTARRKWYAVCQLKLLLRNIDLHAVSLINILNRTLRILNFHVY